VVQASASSEAGPQSTLLQQLRDLGASQAVAVRCEGRANQASRNRAQTLIGSSPQPHQAALIGAFNDGYRSAEGRAEACPVQPTSG
jgi:predicted secreted protein